MSRTQIEQRWRIVAIGLTLASAVLTLLLASQATLIWEEAHYRLAGRTPDWGYPDSPLGAPLLNALSEALFGRSLWGSRLLIWAISALMPLAVWFLATALVDRIQALKAAAVAAILPPFVIAGIYAYPEGPLQVLSVVFLGALIRAIRADSQRWWIIAGAVCAVGAAYYYRFLFMPAGVLVFLLASARGRALRTDRKAWIGGVIAATGLAPSLIHNIREDWGPVLFQLSGRQDWAFWPQAFLYPLEQAALVSAPYFLALAVGAVIAGLRWRKGDWAAGLALISAAALFLPFFGLAFFDKDYLPHWPFLAYGVLTVYVPVAIRRMSQAVPKALQRHVATGYRALAAGVALITLIGFGANLIAWRHPDTFVDAADQGRMTGGDLEDWTVLAGPLADALDAAGPDAVLAVGDHITAVQLQVAARAGAPVFVLDHPEDRSRNFQGYRTLRGEGEADLMAEHAGAPVVIALKEPPYLYRVEETERTAMRARLCGRFEDIARLETRALTPGRVRISLFTARVRETEIDPDPSACALFPPAVIEQPEAGATVSGVIPVYGAAAHPDGVRAVIVSLDGQPVARDNSFFDLEGQFTPLLEFDPGWPEVYWDVRVDLSEAPRGRRVLSIEIITGAGERFLVEARMIYVR